jgi:Prokaryotic RING finger family 1
MELVILGSIVLFVYLIVRLLASFGTWVSDARYRGYRELAIRYRGRYESRGLSDPPTVSFNHNGSAVRVGLAPTIAGQPSQIPRTRVVARFRMGIPFRLELAPIARPAPPQLPKGTRVLKLGIPEFDREFVVQANDLEMARDFLSARTRGSIVQLHRMTHLGGMLVSVNPERMLVQIDRNLGSNAEALGMAVREALSLHDGLTNGVASRLKQGISIVDGPEGADKTGEPPTCKVCLEPIGDGPIVVCAVCNTPHHRDCWDYVGACSIYGCNGKVGVSS